jgi:hypothetical protein
MTLTCKETKNQHQVASKIVDIQCQGFINSKSIKHLSNFVISFSIAIKHWVFTCAMDVKKTSMHTSWLAPTNYIENVNLIWMTNHAKCKGFYINVVEANYPIFGDGGRIVIHNITKDFKMFTLVTNHRIKYIMKILTWHMSYFYI